LGEREVDEGHGREFSIGDWRFSIVRWDGGGAGKRFFALSSVRPGAGVAG
jgi:hypothetical protein